MNYRELENRVRKLGNGKPFFNIHFSDHGSIVAIIMNDSFMMKMDSTHYGDNPLFIEEIFMLEEDSISNHSIIRQKESADHLENYMTRDEVLNTIDSVLTWLEELGEENDR